MRKISSTTAIAVTLLASAPAFAGDIYTLNQNQTGFSLPGVTLPQGQDEVRAADGTTCRSAVSGSGAYIDVGVIGGNGTATGQLATYGRVVVPLGQTPARLNCARLYALEVERLQMEIRLLKMGVGRAGSKSGDTAWASQGWSDGRK